MGFKVMDVIDNKMNGMSTLLQYSISPLLVNEAKEKAYWKDRSGHARQKISGGAEGENGEYTLYLAHGVEYGEWLENGTGIYGPAKKPIVRVDKKILSWVDTEGKRHKRIEVDGMKPMPILHDTLEKNTQNIANKIIQYWES